MLSSEERGQIGSLRQGTGLSVQGVQNLAGNVQGTSNFKIGKEIDIVAYSSFFFLKFYFYFNNRTSTTVLYWQCGYTIAHHQSVLQHIYH